MEPREHSTGTRLMAKRCDQCPACKYARNHPETRFGRVMAWHGSWCPFWKAREEVYGKDSSPGGVMRAG